jgi:cytoplasmic iron level regulating protein YaaA (DUF328/UPF0246 family)
MNINCLNDKIANAKNPLRPIILRAILNIYQNGNNQISAQMVKIECGFIENTISWNNRIPAICNAMRNSLDCGGRISGENRDFNGFTIAFNTTNLKQVITQVIRDKDEMENSSLMTFDKGQNSIFLATCSSAKISEHELKNIPFELKKLSFDNELRSHRNALLDIITNSETVHLRKNEKLKKYISITNKIDFSRSEMAHLVYSEGRFYNNHAACSKEWSSEISHKIYIVSALFGLIKADNYIPLYDLAMTDKINGCNKFAQKFWKGKLDNLVLQLHKDGAKIFNLLSIDYSNCLNEESKSLLITPIIEFTASDAPSKRGKWLKSNI